MPSPATCHTLSARRGRGGLPRGRALALACVATLVLAACGGGDSTGPGGTPKTPEPPPTPTGSVRVSVPDPVPGASATDLRLLPVGGGAPVPLAAGAARTLPVGSWTLSAPRITDARGHSWMSPQDGQAVTVALGATTDLAVTYTQRTGSLVIAIDGVALDRLPARGSAGRPPFRVISRDSAALTPRLVDLGDTLHGVWPGTYDVRAVALTDTADVVWVAADTSAAVSLSTPAETVRATFTFGIAPSAVRFTATGVPAGATPQIDVQRADGPRVMTLGDRVADWPRGASSATLRAIERSGARWSAATAQWTHRNGLDTTITFAVAVSAGRLQLQPTGLPAEAIAAARWTLLPTPAGGAGLRAELAPTADIAVGAPFSTARTRTASPFAQAVAATSGVPLPIDLASPSTDLVDSGTYVLRAEPIALDEVRWRATGPAGTEAGTTIAVRDSLVTVPITYAVERGALQLTVAGVPEGSTAAVQLLAVSGRVLQTPGAVGTFTGTRLIDSLLPGTYRVVAPMILTGAGVRYRAASDTIELTVRSGETASASVTYAESPAIVRVLVAGLPTDLGITPQVTLQAGTSTPVAITPGAALTNVPVGSITVRLTPVLNIGARWSATPVTWTQVAGADTTITLQATLAAGRAQLVPTDLPSSGHSTLPWSVSVTGQPTRTGSGLLIDEVPVGAFSVTLNEVIADGDRWRPVTTGAVPFTMNDRLVNLSTPFTRVSGHLAIVATGLPGGASPLVRVTRPTLGTVIVTRDSTVRGLPVGTTTVVSDTITVGGTKYAPTPRTASFAYAGLGETRTYAVQYASVAAPPPPPPTSDGLVVDQVLVTQAVQTVSGGVPLVAGRPALLRVVVRAVGATASNATVRVRIFHGATEMKDTVLTRAGTVPTTRTDGTLSSTWNWQLPGTLVQSGLSVIATADPNEVITDADRTDNTWPRTGSSGSIPQVHGVPTWRPVMVPLHFTAANLTGNVTAGNVEGTYLDLVRRTMPLNEVVPTVRAAFSLDDPLPTSNDGAGWTTVLQKVNTLRVAEATSNEQYYYGVLPVTYSSGIAGLGYVPGRAAIGWDKSFSASYVAAHEWGHNFSLWHGPCGNPGSEDPGFPHAGGVIGGHGWDVKTNTLRPPTNFDLMGYCTIEVSWISDYFWTKALNHRAGLPSIMGATQSLVVSGRVEGSRITLDPAWLADAPRAAGTSPALATHTLRLYDANDALLLEHPLQASRVDHVEALLFAEAVPVSAAIAERVVRLDERDRLQPLARAEARRRALREQLAAGRVGLARVRAPLAQAQQGGQAGDVVLDTQQVKRVIVRDAATRRVVGLFDRGRIPAAYQGAGFEWLASDGVRSWPIAR